MGAPPAVHKLARFGQFEADLATGELRRRGIKIEIQEQPFRLLAVLLERPGDLVTRDEFRQRLWPDSVFVDFEHGLNRAVCRLRAALGDPADSPRFVETLERRGYRFVAPVEFRDRADPELASARAPAAGAPPAPAAWVVIDGRLVLLAPGSNLVGRSLDAAVFVDLQWASKRHAEIVVGQDGALLRDLASKNGTYLNGRRLVGQAALNDGDRILVGRTVLVFRRQPPDAPTASQDGTRDPLSEDGGR